jgi:hypothetical protein
MNRPLSSTWFLVATALCCGLTVAFASWLADESSDGVRALAALSGLGFGLAIMLLVAWMLDGAGLPRDDAAPAAEAAPAERASPARPVAAPAPLPPAATARPSSPQATAPTALSLRLEAGRALREQLEPGMSDTRVGVWIEGVRYSLAEHRPGVAGYFNALSTRGYADDAERLDAHLGRLSTIVRDFV